GPAKPSLAQLLLLNDSQLLNIDTAGSVSVLSSSPRIIPKPLSGLGQVIGNQIQADGYSITYFADSKYFLVTTSINDQSASVRSALSKLNSLGVDPRFIDFRYDYEQFNQQPATDAGP